MKKIFQTECKVQSFLYKDIDLLLSINNNLCLKLSGLFRRSNMKGFYTSCSPIDKNSYCQDEPLNSFSIFFLIYYKQIRFFGPIEGPIKYIKVLNFPRGPIFQQVQYEVILKKIHNKRHLLLKQTLKIKLKIALFILNKVSGSIATYFYIIIFIFHN